MGAEEEEDERSDQVDVVFWRTCDVKVGREGEKKRKKRERKQRDRNKKGGRWAQLDCRQEGTCLSV